MLTELAWIKRVVGEHVMEQLEETLLVGIKA
jgi:hypothetical protein